MSDIINLKTFAKNLNEMTFRDYYTRLMLIAKSIYKWNLPNNINYKWLEDYLYENGSCVFFYDDTLGYVISGYTSCGDLNNYKEPTLIQPVMLNYECNRILENHIDCVIIRNNDIMMPTSTTLQLFAYRLMEITRTMDVNIKGQKTPTIVLCDDKQKMSFKRALQQINDNEDAVYGYKNFDVDSIKALKLECPIVFDKLRLEKHELLNECYTFLGINNANQNKKERLVDDEVQANNEQVEISSNVFLSSREEAVREIKLLFGLSDNDINVEKAISKVPDIMDEGGNDDD